MSNSDTTVGSCCLVLHSHLPWLAHAGTWPVGEEWLHQAWSAAYLPVVDLLHRLAEEGRRDLLTLGVTPVLAQALDDPYCLAEQHTWVGNWMLRAEELAARAEPHLQALARTEFQAASAASTALATTWSAGASPVLRALVDAGVVELLGGPATHPFLPLLEERLVGAQLQVGLEDTAWRLGRRPAGIWAPECGYRPGLEQAYAEAGVRRFLVDGPTLVAGRQQPVSGQAAPRAEAVRSVATADAWTVGDTDVVTFGRDLEVTYRVWSPRSGYPGGRWYRDFHTFDHASGFRPARVTSTRTPPQDKRPYEPTAAQAAVHTDALDFVDVVRRRLLDLRAARDGRRGVVVAAYDTELFGHWWHEGPMFLEQVLRLLPAAGVEVTTLAGAVAHGAVGGRVELSNGSWGSGKDWRVWDGEQVRDLVAASAAVQARLVKMLDEHRRPDVRDRVLDQLVREAFLVTSSDWAFMVTKNSAADYARRRAAEHGSRFHHLADLVEQRDPRAGAYAAELARRDGIAPDLDARLV